MAIETAECTLLAIPSSSLKSIDDEESSLLAEAQLAVADETMLHENCSYQTGSSEFARGYVPSDGVCRGQTFGSWFRSQRNVNNHIYETDPEEAFRQQLIRMDCCYCCPQTCEWIRFIVHRISGGAIIISMLLLACLLIVYYWKSEIDMKLR